MKKEGLLNFRILGWFEGLSLLILLFIAMPLKYAYGQPIYVRIVGSAHGFLFVAYCLWALWLASKHKWKPAFLLQCLVLSCLPFGTFYFDRKL